jgi:hypothetical protein
MVKVDCQHHVFFLCLPQILIECFKIWFGCSHSQEVNCLVTNVIKLLTLETFIGFIFPIKLKMQGHILPSMTPLTSLLSLCNQFPHENE